MLTAKGGKYFAKGLNTYVYVIFQFLPLKKLDSTMDCILYPSDSLNWVIVQKLFLSLSSSGLISMSVSVNGDIGDNLI